MYMFMHLQFAEFTVQQGYYEGKWGKPFIKYM